MNVLNIIHWLLRKRFTSDAHFKQLEEINAWEDTLSVPVLLVLKHLLL